MQRSVLTGDELSPTTQQVLNVLDLVRHWEDDPRSTPDRIAALPGGQTEWVKRVARAELYYALAKSAVDPGDAQALFLEAVLTALSAMRDRTTVTAAFDPRQHLLAGIYSRGLARFLVLGQEAHGHPATWTSAERLGDQQPFRVVRGEHLYDPEYFDTYLPAEELTFAGRLRNRYREYGVGAALIGVREEGGATGREFGAYELPNLQALPVTADLDVGEDGTIELRLLNSFDTSSVTDQLGELPLSADFTAPLGHMLAQLQDPYERQDLGFFTRDVSLDGRGGLWKTGNAAPGVGGFQHFDGTRWFNFNIYTYGLGGPWGFPTDNVDAIAVRAGGTRVVLNPMFNGIYEWTGSQYVNMQGMGTSDGLVEDSLGRIWSIGNYYSLQYHDGAAWTSVPIAGWGSNVQKDPDDAGMVWAVANFEVVRTDGNYRFSRLTNDFPELNPRNDTLTSVAAAPGGIGWVGSTSGLFRVDSNTGDHQWFHPSNSAIPGNQITPMAVTPDGRVWFTNFGNRSTWPVHGLGWTDGTDFGFYPQAAQLPGGLPHAQIADMEVRVIPDGYELWISCTSEGIAVLTVADVCQPDLGFQGPGSATATLCGTGLNAGESSDYEISGAPGSAAGALFISVDGFVNVPVLGGTLVSFGGFGIQVPLFASGTGTVSIPFTGLPNVVDLVFQSVFLDLSLPQSIAFTNAIKAQYGR